MYSFKRTSFEKLDSIVSTSCKWSNISKNRYVRRHVVQANLTNVFLHQEIKEMKDGEYKLELGNGQSVAQA